MKKVYSFKTTGGGCRVSGSVLALDMSDATDQVMNEIAGYGQMSEFKSCPVCHEQSDQCLPCASYVVDGERIYYEKLKDFGATKDHEVRFINRIQKQRTTAFFHNGKLYIPSRQGRSVPLAIGLQWDAWQEQQVIIDDLRSQLNNMEQCYISKKKECESIFTSIDALENKFQAARVLCETACELLDGYAHQDAMVILDDLEEALRGASD